MLLPPVQRGRTTAVEAAADASEYPPDVDLPLAKSREGVEELDLADADAPAGLAFGKDVAGPVGYLAAAPMKPTRKTSTVARVMLTARAKAAWISS
ncbi:hypothetical protein EF912_02320 [Streptomyces sp. WAC07061]|uniref:hypothetical protein n=1 Tax=Streptomyces sp. WAC07061 TaxID=2487410 RepID=UPI000F76B332|nr:hypothetical protein [Streptomyces sp. WAC07061]RSS64110.1 hypothetical protein EF912_02320 [Streptomyces sp. WAC07061]